MEFILVGDNLVSLVAYEIWMRKLQFDNLENKNGLRVLCSKYYFPNLPFLGANNLSKSALQYGFPSRSKNSVPDSGFLQGPVHTKWSSCHTWFIAFKTFYKKKSKMFVPTSVSIVQQNGQFDKRIIEWNLCLLLTPVIAFLHWKHFSQSLAVLHLSQTGLPSCSTNCSLVDFFLNYFL